MRPLLPFVPPGGDAAHRIDIAGELRLEAAQRVRVEPFACRSILAPGVGTASILTVRSASAEDVLDLDLQGTLQRDGLLMVTITLRIHHPPDEDGGLVEAETTVVPAGAAPAFRLACADTDGCVVSAHGSIAHERSSMR